MTWYPEFPENPFWIHKRMGSMRLKCDICGRNNRQSSISVTFNVIPNDNDFDDRDTLVVCSVCGMRPMPAFPGMKACENFADEYEPKVIEVIFAQDRPRIGI
jgi:hypothetical protein